MKITRKKDGIDYIEFIRSINGRIERMGDIAVSPKILTNTILLRHDVDHDMEHALQFAYEERKAGIQATYFLLHTAGYFDYSERFAAQCGKLADLGHEVGLHNNTITAWMQSEKNETMTEIINKPLDFLRSTCGITVKGTSSHGDPLCYTHNYVNYEMWKECPRERKNPDLGYAVFPLAHFGLTYEAYFLKRDAYLSDSGGIWRGVLKTEPDTDFSVDQNDSPEVDAQRFVAAFNECLRGILHLLVHPMWWDIN